MTDRNNRTRKTSFGSMAILSEDPKVEKMVFEKEGKSHTHDSDEYCYVVSGSGRVVGANKEEVASGDFCRVAPQTPHWMIPNETPFTLIIFYGQPMTKSPK